MLRKATPLTTQQARGQSHKKETFSIPNHSTEKVSRQKKTTKLGKARRTLLSTLDYIIGKARDFKKTLTIEVT